MTSAIQQPDRPSTPTGAAVRFPFPPALFAVPLAAALIAERTVVRLPLPGAGSVPLTRAGIAVGAAGMALGASGVAAVLRRRTTVVPHRPVARLVTSGPYRVSRNPMYAGQVVALVGVGLTIGSWWPLAAAAVGMFATTRLVIEPEEDYLADRFGVEYARYRSKVRRWL